MDGLEFSEKIVGHLVTLVVAFAWPAVVVYFLYTQRAAFTKLIESLKIKSIEAFGGKLETQLEENTKTVDEAVAVAEAIPVEDHVIEPPAPAFEQDIDVEAVAPHVVHDDIKPGNLVQFNTRLSKYMKSAPNVVIEAAWQDVRRALIHAVGTKTLVANMWEEQGWLTDEKLVAKVAQSGKLNSKLVQAVQQLMRIHNDATAASIGWQPSQSEAADYVKNAGQIIELLSTAGKK